MIDEDEAVGDGSDIGRARTVRSRRSWLPTPRDVLGAAVCALVVVALYSPVLFGGRSLSGFAFSAYGIEGSDNLHPDAPLPEDVYRLDHGASAWQFEPWAEATAESYRAGTVPLWNPYQGAGAPLAANMQSAVFDPFMLAVNLNPTPLMWDVTIVMALVGSGVLTFAFMRVVGVGALGAVVASSAFSLSGYFFLYNNGHIIRAQLYLPALFLCVELLSRSRRFLPVVGLAFAVAGTILAGFPEAAVVVVGAAALYGVVRVAQNQQGADVWRRLARLFGAIGLGVGLVAPLVLLLAEYVALSFDTHTVEGVGDLQLRGILNLIVPFFNGPPRADSLGVGWTGTRQWFGAGIAMLAVVGISARSRSWRRYHTLAFTLVGLVVFLKVYDFRLLEWVGRLPIFNSVRFTRDGLPTLAFIVASLAGVGIEVIRNRDINVRAFLLLSVGAAGGLGLLIATDENRQFIAATMGTYALRQFGLAAIAAVVVLVVALTVSEWRHGVWVVAVVVVAELFILAPRGNLAPRAEPFPPTAMTAIVQDLAADPKATRVFGFEGKLFPNTPGAYGLYDVGVLDGLLVERYVNYMSTFFEPGMIDRLVGRIIPTDDRPGGRYIANPMFDLLGARYLVTASPLRPDDPSDSEVPIRLIAETNLSYIYENTNVLPRAWVVSTVHQVSDQASALGFFESVGRRDDGNVLEVTSFDPRGEAVAEVGEESPSAELGGVGACESLVPAKAVIEEYTADYVAIDVTSDCPGLLILSDTWYPGWSAYVNDEWRRSYPTNIAFRGVPVSAGVSRVEFRYEPGWWRVGLFVSILSLAILIGWGAVARRRALHDVSDQRASAASDG